jgi:gliding motility-associated-like protein
MLTELMVSNGPEVSFTANRSCGFATADVQLTVTGGIFPYRYDWSDPAVEGDRVSLPSGTYQVTVNDALGCQPAIEEITIDSIVPGALDFRTEAPFCPGEQTGLIRLQPPGTGSLRLLPDGVFVTDQIDSLLPGSYGIILRDSTGCEAFRQISINSARPAEISINAPAFVRLGDQVTLSADATFGSLFTNFQWSAADSVNCSNCPTASLQPSVSGLVMVEANTLRGCPVSDSLFLNVIPGPARIYLPSGFSPNGDLVNDLWEPGLGPEVETILSWQVYDRWGGLVWDYGGNENWWAGADQSVGLYTYRFSAVLIDGRIVDKTGEVTLIR